MPVATVFVRLIDVAPDGSSALVATGVLNLTHRRSHAEPLPLVPGVVEEVRIPMRASGYRWPAGHRIRLAVMSGYWPVLWPSPLPGDLDIHRGRTTPSRLVLPVLPDDAPTLPVPPYRTAPGRHQHRAHLRGWLVDPGGWP
jgi:predicted acyl esterase